MYYTYAYLRQDGTPYYIGKGSGDRAYRRTKRCIKPPKDKNRILYLKQNIIEEEEAYKHEIYMISIFGRKDLGTGILYNRTNGGSNPPSWLGRKHTKDTIEKICEIQKNRIRKRKPKHLLKTFKDCPSYKNKLKGDNSKNLLKGDMRTKNQKNSSEKHSKTMAGITPTNSISVVIFNKSYVSIRQACTDNDISYSQYKFLITSSVEFKSSEELKKYIWNNRNEKLCERHRKNKVS
jgi:hypothetical protein